MTSHTIRVTFVLCIVWLNSLYVNAQNNIGFQLDTSQSVVFGVLPDVQGPMMSWFADLQAMRAGLFEANFSAHVDLIGQYSFSAGAHNRASDVASVSLGYYNESSGRASTSFGESNDATGDYSTAMGFHTIASGKASLAMGEQVTASGDYSTAIGKEVSTNNRNGAIILGDSDPLNLGWLYADTSDQFVARFANGYDFRTSKPGTNWLGVFIVPGGNAWQSYSDMNRKSNFETMDDRLTLAKLKSIEFSSWNYKGQSPATTRHYGIMAQDFYRLFGRDSYGTIGDDTSVNPIDMMGVAMSGIKGAALEIEDLAQTVKELSTVISSLQDEVRQLRAMNEDLKRRNDY